jgi:hypothetical protein
MAIAVSPLRARVAPGRARLRLGSRLACKDRATCQYLVENFLDLLAVYYLPMEGSNIIEKYIRK